MAYFGENIYEQSEGEAQYRTDIIENLTYGVAELLQIKYESTSDYQADLKAAEDAKKSGDDDDTDTASGPNTKNKQKFMKKQRAVFQALPDFMRSDIPEEVSKVLSVKEKGKKKKRKKSDGPKRKGSDSDDKKNFANKLSSMSSSIL